MFVYPNTKCYLVGVGVWGPTTCMMVQGEIIDFSLLKYSFQVKR